MATAAADGVTSTDAVMASPSDIERCGTVYLDMTKFGPVYGQDGLDWTMDHRRTALSYELELRNR